MTKPKVVVVDYGVGNLLSVMRAVEECGAEAIMSSEREVIGQAERIILPGVGSFAYGMQALESRGLVELINAIATNGIPMLGICLGMQLLLDESEEHGVTKGLGIIPGRVVPVPALGIDGTSLKIPHIGWNSLVVSESAIWNRSIMQNLTPGDAFYFVHSYMVELEDPAMRIADCHYGGNRVSAVIGKDNVFGCQFHPEKSGRNGIRILKNFCSLHKKMFKG